MSGTFHNILYEKDLSKTPKYLLKKDARANIVLRCFRMYYITSYSKTTCQSGAKLQNLLSYQDLIVSTKQFILARSRRGQVLRNGPSA